MSTLQKILFALLTLTVVCFTALTWFLFYWQVAPV